MFPCEEGFNGWYYSEEYEETYTDGGLPPRHTRRKPVVTRNTFVANSRYYHVQLFGVDERYRIVHETDRAVLYEVQKGKFWVPKALMKGKMVHRAFKRKYLPNDLDDFDVIGDRK